MQRVLQPQDPATPSAMDGGPDADAWRWRNDNDAMSTHFDADHRLSLDEKRVGTSGTYTDSVTRETLRYDGSWIATRLIGMYARP